MKRGGRIWTLVVVVHAACGVPRLAAEPAPLPFSSRCEPPELCRGAAPHDLSRLGWLEGSWYGVEKGLGSEEHWTSPAGGGLIGMHKDVRGGRMTGFEFLRIGMVDDAGASGGSIAYVASPGGAPPTAFRLKELGEQSVVFENLEHDFPQRIIYRLDTDGALQARVEGVVDGQVASMEWTWRRK